MQSRHHPFSFGTAKRRELIVHVEGHITLTSLASFRSFLTFVPDGLIEDMAALLVRYIRR